MPTRSIRRLDTSIRNDAGAVDFEIVAPAHRVGAGQIDERRYRRMRLGASRAKST
jgi:hypothetical protein